MYFIYDHEPDPDPKGIYSFTPVIVSTSFIPLHHLIIVKLMNELFPFLFIYFLCFDIQKIDFTV